jgi:hypothetical protein
MMSGQLASGGSASFGGSMMYWIGIDQLSVQALFRTPRKGLSGNKPPNGVRYPQVGGMRQRHFDGTNSKL